MTMKKVPADPPTTLQLFQHARVAAGYISARPFLHPEVFERVRGLIGPFLPLRRALDVGCGTGMSSVALRGLAQDVVGIDASLHMLRLATRADRLRYAASSAEALPFLPGSFDLIAACGSMEWVDRLRFLPRAAELLRSGGWLVPLDFGDTGRSADVPDLERWYETAFLRAYPRPPARDPMVTGEEAVSCGLSDPVNHTFVMPCSLTAQRYAEFLMTESNVIAAVEYGTQTADRVRGWLQAELAPLFGGKSREVLFGGYVQVLRKL